MEQADIQRASSFDCGVPVLNNWLQKIAWPSHQGGGAKVYLSLDAAQDLIAAYFCLSAAQVDHAVAPSRMVKGMGQGGIPVVLIGRFAVDLRYRGGGVGAFMIRHAFIETLKTADRIGVRAIIVEAKDSTGASFYTHLGFSAFVSDPLRLFLLIKDLRRSITVAMAAP